MSNSFFPKFELYYITFFCMIMVNWVMVEIINLIHIWIFEEKKRKWQSKEMHKLKCF